MFTPTRERLAKVLRSVLICNCGTSAPCGLYKIIRQRGMSITMRAHVVAGIHRSQELAMGGSVNISDGAIAERHQEVCRIGVVTGLQSSLSRRVERLELRNGIWDG